MTIIKYETPTEKLLQLEGEVIFLAGPTVRHHQPHLISWRNSAVKFLQDKNYSGTVIIPEFETPVKTADFDVPMWEYEGLKRADKIVVWLPRTEEMIGLTTNFEMGFWVARAQEKVFYGRPDTAYRISYTDAMWKKLCQENNLDRQIFNNLENLLEALIN